MDDSAPVDRSHSVRDCGGANSALHTAVHPFIAQLSTTRSIRHTAIACC